MVRSDKGKRHRSVRIPEGTRLWSNGSARTKGGRAVGAWAGRGADEVYLRGRRGSVPLRKYRRLANGGR